MAAVTKDERKIRIDHMKTFGQWLKDNGRTQKWAGRQLGIYPGYLSNLVTGKQMASEDVCRKAGKLMGPLDASTGKPAGTGWTNVERRDEQDKKRRKKIERAERKRAKKKVAKRRTQPAKPEDLPFDPEPPKKANVAAKLTKKPRITSWETPKKHVWDLVTFEEVEERREQLGVSKAAMAKMLEVTNSTYHNWKRGVSVPPKHRQLQIKRKLGSSLASRHAGFSNLNLEEQRAATDVILMCIHTMPPMTGDGLIKVIEAVVEGFTQPYVA